MFVPVHCAVVPFVSVVLGGQTSAPPAGPIGTVVLRNSAGEKPLPSDGGANSAVIRLVPRLPNIVTVTQFWLGRGPIEVVDPTGAIAVRALVGPSAPPMSFVT